MQKKVIVERQDRILIDTPYGTIESDSGNHLIDIATVVFIVLVCALLKFKGALLLKNMLMKK